MYKYTFIRCIFAWLNVLHSQTIAVLLGWSDIYKSIWGSYYHPVYLWFLQCRLMQHFTTHDTQSSDWKLNDPLGFNLQQRGHCLSVGICLTVSCTQINLASKHYTPFCHDGMLHQSVLKKFGCITDIQGFTSIFYWDLFLDQGKQNMRKEV